MPGILHRWCPRVSSTVAATGAPLDAAQLTAHDIAAGRSLVAAVAACGAPAAVFPAWADTHSATHAAAAVDSAWSAAKPTKLPAAGALRGRSYLP